MLTFLKLSAFCLGLFFIAGAFSLAASGQNLSINYFYQLEPAMITAAPEMIGAPQIDYPDEARKQGVEGRLKASFTIAVDGSTKDIAFEQTLPFGIEVAVKSGLERLRFKPAQFQGSAVEVKMKFDYIVSAVYEESDKSVSKPKIISQPDPVYPGNFISEKLKGEVFVKILCAADGKVKVIGVSSVMPKEFDTAAIAAAEKVTFTPAVHKKSKSAVSQTITIKYKFKP